MAGDWIKMRTDLYRDPKVCAIADQLMNQEGELAAYVNQNCQRNMTVTRNVMRNVTVGALVTVWGVMRLRGKRVNDDLVLKFGTLWIIDDLSELPGFGQALANVGWVLADGNGIVFPNFFSEYNVDPNEDANAKNAERQRRYREKAKIKSNVTNDVMNASQSNAREEKRREEKIYSVPKGTGDKSPLSPEQIIFGYGIPLLTNAGTAEKQSRSFLGGLRKAHGDDALINALRDCLKEKPLQPLEWLAAILPPSPRANKQEKLEAQNRAVVKRLLDKEQAHESVG